MHTEDTECDFIIAINLLYRAEKVLTTETEKKMAPTEKAHYRKREETCPWDHIFGCLEQLLDQKLWGNLLNCL